MSDTRQRVTGTVKWFNASKGYGFVVATNGGPDTFLPAREIEDSGLDPLAISPGQRISFAVKASRDGRTVACDIKRLD